MLGLVDRGFVAGVLGLALVAAELPAAAEAAVIRVPAGHATIQAAIDAAVAGDTVVVAPGLYRENLTFRGKAITVTSERGPEATIVDGSRAGSVVSFTSGEGPGSVLQGLTLQNGYSMIGGGINVSASSPTIRGNVVARNLGCTGAGISIRDGSPVVSGNHISDNRWAGCSGGPGGGIHAGGATSVTIVGNLITRNEASGDGGGIELSDTGSSLIRGNVIEGNKAAFGGGIAIYSLGDAAIVQNLVVGNVAYSGGGVYWFVRGGPRGPVLVSNTIAGNDSAYGSGVLADGDNSDAALIANNLIIAKAGQAAVRCHDFTDSFSARFRFNNVYSASGIAYAGVCSDRTGLDGNISADPLFLDPAGGDYRLLPGSPAIDRGTATVPDLPDTDLDGDPRTMDGDEDGVSCVDMGAFESPPSPGYLTFRTSAVAAEEATGGASIVVVRKGGTSGTVTVDFAASDGTASADRDYLRAAGTLVFGPGEFVKSFPVLLVPDDVAEGSETVHLALSRPTGGAALGARSTAVLTITEAGVLQLGSSAYSVDEGAGAAVVSVRRTGGQFGEVSATLTTGEGTAAVGDDYLPVAVTVTFAHDDAGEKTVAIPLANDSHFEGDEILLLTLGAPKGGASLGTPSTAVVTIADDEPPPLDATPYFPLRGGDSWIYRVNGTSVTRMVLPDTVTVGGVPTRAVRDSDDGAIQFLTSDSDGIRLHRVFAPGADIGLGEPVDLEITYTPPIVMASAVTAIGRSENSDGVASTNHLPGVGVLSIWYSTTYTVQAQEIVTVPAGTFQALRLHGTLNFGGDVVTETLHLAKYVGLVRTTETDGSQSLTAELTDVTVIPSWPTLLAAVLPGSRSVRVGTAATGFATIANAGWGTATDCGLGLAGTLPAAFMFQTTDPATNAPAGPPNTPVDIVAGGSQSYVFAVTPIIPVAPTEISLRFDCTNGDAAQSVSGVNTLLFSASATPVPDIVAVAVTPSGDGVIHAASAAAFAVATANVGAEGAITVSVDTGSAVLPLSLALCQTDPVAGTCTSPAGPALTTQMATSMTSTFAVFVGAGGPVAFDPAAHRVFVRFSSGGVTRGATSVAVRTD